MTGPQAPAPAAPGLPTPQPGRGSDIPAGAGARATPAGDHGEDARAKWKTALAAHNAAKRRGRFTRAARRTGPGMIRRPAPPPDPPDNAA